MPIVFNQRPKTWSAWNDSGTVHFGTYHTKAQAQERLDEAETQAAIRQRKLYEYRTGKKLRGRIPDAVRKQETKRSR